MEVLNPAGAVADEPPGPLSGALLAAARAPDPGARERVRALSAQLHGVDPGALRSDSERIAFWLNLYNALFLHASSVRPPRIHLALNLRLFRTWAYRVGPHDYSLDVIEHGVLRRNRPPPRARRGVLRAGDERLQSAPAHVDPRIHFALNCGARSCPPIRAYQATGLDDQLRVATSSYMSAEAPIDRAHRRVQLPGLMRLYRGDFGEPAEALAFAARHLPRDDGIWLADNAARVGVGYRRFNARIAP